MLLFLFWNYTVRYFHIFFFLIRNIFIEIGRWQMNRIASFIEKKTRFTVCAKKKNDFPLFFIWLYGPNNKWNCLSNTSIRCKDVELGVFFLHFVNSIYIGWYFLSSTRSSRWRMNNCLCLKGQRCNAAMRYTT